MNKKLLRAKANKNDEFYTRLVDIEKELKYYSRQFNNKIVYCNTDNYKKSNFVKYFVDGFHRIGLKKIISLDLDGYYFEYDGKNKKYSKLENGDFRSGHSIEILKNVDIVCTNPPFSLFREYIEQLVKYNKEFLIIGSFNAVTYKSFFHLIKNNRVWLGYNPRGMNFKLPNGKLKKVNACWFTNINIRKRYKNIILHKKYYGNEEKYPKYDNYDAIEVSRVKNIPKDYRGIMGVPITFLTKYNPDQFEIVGYTGEGKDGRVKCLKFYKNLHQGKVGEPFVRNMKPARFSPMISCPKRLNKTCYIADNADGFLLQKYHRVFIRNRQI